MKKFLIILFLSTIIFGCSKKESDKPADLSAKMKADTTAIKTTPIDNPTQKFNIAYKFEKGKTYQYRIASFSEDNLIIKADTSVTKKIKQSVIYIINVDLANLDKDGVMEFNCEIKSILFNAAVDGQMEMYQSGETKDSTELEKYAQYASLINNPFSVRVGKAGGVLEIFRVDKIVNNFIELNKKSPASVNQEQRDYLNNNVTQGSLKPLVTQLFREMPTNTIAKDSSWAFTQPPAPFLIFKLENTNLFKVNGLEKYNSDTVAIITAGLKTVVTGDTKYEERGAQFNFTKPVTTADGAIYFNVSKGCVQKSNIKTHIHIYFTMEAPSPKGKQKGNKTEDITNTNIVELL